MAQIEFPILVPDDVPLMDETQLINYISSRTCEDVGNVIHDLIITKAEETKELNAAIVKIKQEAQSLGESALTITRALEDLEDGFIEL